MPGNAVILRRHLSDVRRLTVLLLTLTTVACAPMAGQAPFATLERAHVVPNQTRAATVAVGVGGAAVGWPELGGGGLLKLRQAISEESEVSFSGQAIFYECSGCKEELQETHLALAGRVGYKRALLPNIAMIAGAGYAGGAGGKAITADAGILGDFGKWSYLSVRFGLANPVAHSGAYNVTEMRSLPQDPVTTYYMATFGVRSPGTSGFVAELGAGAIVAGSEAGGALFFAIGLERLELP